VKIVYVVLVFLVALSILAGYASMTTTVFIADNPKPHSPSLVEIMDNPKPHSPSPDVIIADNPKPHSPSLA